MASSSPFINFVKMFPLRHVQKIYVSRYQLGVGVSGKNKPLPI